MEFNSHHLKTAIMAYYRFKKQAVCADEVYLGRYICDVLIDTGKEIIEVECKTSKSDLWADIKKGKHNNYKLIERYACPMKFYICVPSILIEEAKKFVGEVNSSYGIIELSETKYNHWSKYKRGWENMLYFVKKAKKLHNNYRIKQEMIGLRNCSAIINQYINMIN